MQKLTVAVVSAALLAGCASTPEAVTTTYSYDSKLHSSTVVVNEKRYLSEKVHCAAGWQEGETYTPKGLPDSLWSKFSVDISVSNKNDAPEQFSFAVPKALGSRVLVEDYQEHREYMLGADQNGIVVQGEHFYHPHGYVVRVSNVQIDGWMVKACVGIDRSYVLDSELDNSKDPRIRIERLLVPYIDSTGEGVMAAFGVYGQNIAHIRVLPK